MPVRNFTLAFDGLPPMKVEVDLQTRQNYYKIGPGHMRHGNPPCTFWGTILTPLSAPGHAYLLGRCVLVESDIEIYLEGNRFIDVQTYDQITERELPWWPPPEVPGCHAIDESYASVSGRKLRFDSEGGIILN